MSGFFGCLIGHRWIYSVEDITYKRMFSVSVFGSNTNALDELVLPTQVRYCNRCSKKQRFSIGSDWTDWDSLSIQEIRDKKLSELGI